MSIGRIHSVQIHSIQHIESSSWSHIMLHSNRSRTQQRRGNRPGNTQKDRQPIASTKATLRTSRCQNDLVQTCAVMKTNTHMCMHTHTRTHSPCLCVLWLYVHCESRSAMHAQLRPCSSHASRAPHTLPAMVVNCCGRKWTAAATFQHTV